MCFYFLVKLSGTTNRNKATTAMKALGSIAHSLQHSLTCGVIPQQLVVSIYNGRCGCTPQHTSWGDIGVRLRVNILDTFPWHSWLEF